MQSIAGHGQPSELYSCKHHPLATEEGGLVLSVTSRAAVPLSLNRKPADSVGEMRGQALWGEDGLFHQCVLKVRTERSA
jgi:hypothetical protein